MPMLPHAAEDQGAEAERELGLLKKARDSRVTFFVIIFDTRQIPNRLWYRMGRSTGVTVIAVIMLIVGVRRCSGLTLKN